MEESRTIKILNTTIIFTKDQSIEDGMVLVDSDGSISLMTVVEFSDFLLKAPIMNIKIIKYRMNLSTETIIAKIQEDRVQEIARLKAALELEKETKRARVAEVKASISAVVEKINGLLANTVGYNLAIIEEIEQEISKLRELKKPNPENMKRFIEKFEDINRRILDENTRSVATIQSYSDSIRDKLLASVSEKLFFHRSIDPDLETILLTLEYASELEKEVDKKRSEFSRHFDEIFKNLESLAHLINKIFASSVRAEKRARAASVSSVESEGASAESILPKGSLLKLVAEAQAAPPELPRHPVVKKKSRIAEVELVLEPEKAKDVLRFVVAHNQILKVRLEPRLEARLELIQTRLEMFVGLRKVVPTSPDIDAALQQVILYRDEVVDQPFVVKAKSLWEDLDKACKLLTSVSEKVEPCSGGAAGGGGCPEANLAAHAMDVLEGRRVKWIEAEAIVLETLIAQKQVDHEMAVADARVGWAAQKYKVANYAEFIEHIRQQAAAIGLIVINGTPKDPSKDPRPAIYIQTTAKTPLHLTLSPDVLTSGKFHMTHNNLPEASKRFYFSIKYDPGHDRPYIVADGTSERIEIGQIAQRFIDELTRAGQSTVQINEEVKLLLEFLMSNIDTQSTKRRGGYYEKYMKYKAKYLRLKALGI